MKLMGLATSLGGFAAILSWSVLFVHPGATAEPPEPPSSQAVPEQGKPAKAEPAAGELTPTALEDRATQILSRYCVSCHDPGKQEGEVRLAALETADG